MDLEAIHPVFGSARHMGYLFLFLDDWGFSTALAEARFAGFRNE